MSDAPPHPAAHMAAEPHLAGSLVSLKAGIDAHWPGRDKRSDGFIGDDRHKAEGKGSDHNAWLNNTIRAGDFTTTQTHPEPVHGVDGPWLAEQLRLLGASGDPRLAGGGYVIYNGHITSPDFTRWLPYEGDPHTTHVHVSVSRNPAGYEYSGPWQFLAVVPLHPGPSRPPAPARHVAPVPPAPDHQLVPAVGPHEGNTAHEAPAPIVDPDGPEPSGYPGAGYDASGTGPDFRAQYGNEGPGVKRLQVELNRDLPAYSALEEDGLYGPETAAVLQDFAHRVAADAASCPEVYRDALARAHGDNVGPALAAVFPLYGIHV